MTSASTAARSAPSPGAPSASDPDVRGRPRMAKNDNVKRPSSFRGRFAFVACLSSSKAEASERRDLDAGIGKVEAGHQPEKMHFHAAAHAGRKADEPAQRHMHV